jgi:hypothetical protein
MKKFLAGIVTLGLLAVLVPYTQAKPDKAQGPHEIAAGELTAVVGSTTINLEFNAHDTDPAKGHVVYSSSTGGYFEGNVDCYANHGDHVVFSGTITEGTYPQPEFGVAIKLSDPKRVRVPVGTNLGCGAESSFPAVVTEDNMNLHLVPDNAPLTEPTVLSFNNREEKGKPDDVPHGPASMINVCHHTEGVNEYILINISENALDSHLAHGDALPGDTYPGDDTKKFSDDCSVIDKWVLLDTVTVPSNEAVASTDEIISPEATYLLKASGIYVYATWAGDPVADAKCSYRGSADPLGFSNKWLSGDLLPSPYTHYLEVKVNNNAVNWGVASGTCNDTTNEYSMQLTGVDHLDFNIYDGGAVGDNSGNITVEI